MVRIKLLITVKIFNITGFIKRFFITTVHVIIFIDLIRKIINTMKITNIAVLIIRVARVLHVKRIMVMIKILITVKIFNMTGFISPFLIIIVLVNIIIVLIRKIINTVKITIIAVAVIE